MTIAVESDIGLKTRFYFRDSLCGLDEGAGEYVRRIIRNTDLGSEFDKIAAPLRSLTDAQLIQTVPRLYEAGYDVMIAFQEQKTPHILGNMAFQEHKDDPQWRMFGLYIDESQRGKGYGTQLTRRFIQHARDCGIKTVRLGAGN